jgi:VWFA-related protein
LTPFALTTISAQQQQQKVELDDQPIKVDVDVVNLFCSVRNQVERPDRQSEEGRLRSLRGRQASDHQILFAGNRSALTIGLLVDVSGSQRNLIEIERQASTTFFSSVLKKKDVAFLISFGADVELLQDITGTPRLLQQGLGRLQLNTGYSGPTGGIAPSINRPRGTLLYDAVYLAAGDMLAKEAGRKVIVLITDGEDQGSRETEKQAIEAAQKADAIIYSILYVDRQFYGRGGMGYSGEGTLKKMSERDRRPPVPRG